ncbi:MAG: ergothioneine biosynthesis protein EgtB, partial [Planctomycetota bacterium]
MSYLVEETNQLLASYRSVRQTTDRIVAPLSPEDCMVQSMEDASPTRWHMAHTTWFFETFVLKTLPEYKVLNPKFNFLFNSYYNSIGEQFPRPQRGLISRPGLKEVRGYRDHVDRHMTELLESGHVDDALERVIKVGLHHEQQHQELILTDIKHALACNPTLPAYNDSPLKPNSHPLDNWIAIESGVYEIGFEGKGFSFDNESPRHDTYIQDCEISTKLVTCGDYLTFIEDGGYSRPEYWLSLGWSAVQANHWDAPLYWMKKEDRWFCFTLAGLKEINKEWPVCHLSYFEADAFARWSGHRLPTEFEWEVAERSWAEKPNPSHFNEEPFVDVLLSQNHAIHPTQNPKGLMGSVWQWTSSSYSAYPGYRPPDGAIGEYNGKFMS